MRGKVILKGVTLSNTYSEDTLLRDLRGDVADDDYQIDVLKDTIKTMCFSTPLNSIKDGKTISWRETYAEDLRRCLSLLEDYYNHRYLRELILANPDDVVMEAVDETFEV